MKKIIEMTTVKFIQDKGRQERTMAMILSFIFGSCLKNDEEKSLFNQLLKKIFEFEPNSLMEELISNLLKEKINQLGLKSNQNQLQRVLNTYLRFIKLIIFCIFKIDDRFIYWIKSESICNIMRSTDHW